MAQERGYEQVTSPQAGAALPMPTADQFGAGVGDSLAKLGEQVHGQQIRAFEIDKKITHDQELSAVAHRLALHGELMDQTVMDARTSPDPGGANHVKNVMAANDAGRSGVFDGITDPQVLRYAQAEWDQSSAQINSQEGNWAQGQAIAKSVIDFQAGDQVDQARVFRDPSQLPKLMTGRLTAIELMHVPPDVKDKLALATIQGMGGSALDSLVRTDPEGTKQRMQAGEFDYMGGDALRAANDHADAEIRTRAVQARVELAAKVTDYNQRSALTIKAINDGQPIDEKAIDGLLAEGGTLGVAPERLYDLSQARVTNQVGHEYHAATPVMIEADLAALDTKIAKLGDKVPVPMVQRRAALAKVLEARRSAVKADPLAVAARSGIQVPDVDWSAPNGSQIAARVQAGHSASALTGAPLTFFRADEANQFKQEYAKGAQGQLNVLHVLDNFTDPFDRAAAAMQLAPADTNFQHMTQLRPEHRAVVQRGQQARAANKAFFTPPTGDPEGVGAAMAQIDQEQAFALRAMHPVDAGAIRDNARDWYAGLLSGRGHQSVNEGFSANDYQVAMRVAGGGTVAPRARGGSTGGMGYWQGTPFWVPDGFSHEGFEMAVLRDLAAQSEAHHGPVQPDGKTPFDIMKKAWPTMIAPGRYRWDTKGGTVRRRGGGDYITTAEAGR